MLNGQSRTGTQDFPPILALVALGLVVGAYFYFESPTTFSFFFLNLDKFVDAHANFIFSVLFLFSVNLVWIYSVVTRTFGLNKQGSRLELLTGKRPEQSKGSLRSTSISIGNGLAVFGLLLLLDLPNPNIFKLLFQSKDICAQVTLILRANFAMSAFALSIFVSRFSPWTFLLKLKKHELPEIPKPENGIVLGTVGEDDKNGIPEWVVLNRRALNGNILITGSIGGGKTQGTILPYLDQILGNFKVRPSILAIDPKGTFVPEALKIIEKHGMSEHVLHMRLGSNVTFNPIFSRDPLKEANFLDIAQMIRAAAVNYMGKGFDSPFWELSSFNLIKNTLVLCGAKYREV